MVIHALDHDVIREINNPLCVACRAPVHKIIGRKDGYNILRCERCRSAQIDPYPAQNPEAPDHLIQMETTKRDVRRAKKILRQVMAFHPPGNTFLNMGEKMETDALAQAAEISGLKTTSLNPPFTAIDLDLPQKKFDFVSAQDIVHQRHDLEAVIGAIAKRLKPGGVLFLTCPDGNHRRVPKDFARWESVTPPHAMTYLSREGLTSLLSRHDLYVRKFQLSLTPSLRAFATRR